MLTNTPLMFRVSDPTRKVEKPVVKCQLRINLETFVRISMVALELESPFMSKYAKYIYNDH